MVKLSPSKSAEACSESMTNSEKTVTNGEVNRLRDIGDEDGLLLVIDEEVQRARRCIEVDFQHDRRWFVECFASIHRVSHVADNSIPAAAKSDWR
jgi:hypothetical protein